MGYRQITTDKRKLTKKLASEFSQMITIDHDRNLSETRLEGHMANVENGTFYSPDWAKCLCKEDGVTYRVNGKHTSTMFSLDEVIIPNGLYVNIKTFEADTLEDVAMLYTTFDCPESAKSSGDTTKAIIYTEESLRGLPTKFINDVTKAINYAAVQDKIYDIKLRDRAKKAIEPDNVKFILWLREHLHDGNAGKGKNHVWRSPVMSAMYLTYQKSQKDSIEFWSRVRDETGASPDLPCRKLAKWLTATSLNNKPGLAKEFFVRSVQAWNAFRQSNESANLNYYKSNNLPKVV